MSRGAILSLTILLVAVGGARAGATRCWIDDGALVIAGRFGDIAGDFLVETAAPYSQINETEANAAGFGGPFATATLGVADHRLEATRLPLVSLDGLPQTDTAIVGVIGQDVLSRYALRVRFSPCRLVLSRVPIGPRERSLRLRRLAGLPAVEAAYGDGSLERREPMLVSTGRWESLIPRASLSRTPAEGARPPVRLKWLEIGGQRIAPAPAALAQAQVGTIGMSALTRWRGFRLTRNRFVLTR